MLSDNWLMRHMDVTHTMLIALVTPVVAVMLGMIVLRKRRKSLSVSEEEPELVPKP